MRSRLIVITVAVLLGLAAAFGAMRYLQSEQERVAQGTQLINVLVAQQDLPTGMTTDELIAKGYLTQRQIPRQYVAASAVSSRAMLDGKVVAQPISKDQQVTTGMFKYASDIGLAPSTPKDFVAISVPYDAARGVGGLLKPGDSVAVFGTFTAGQGGVDTAVTKMILPRAKILAVDQTLASSGTGTQNTSTVSNSSGSPLASSGGSQQQQTMVPTVTLALTPADAEKLVFAQEEGKVWLGLYSPTDPNTPVTTGVRYGQVVR